MKKIICLLVIYILMFHSSHYTIYATETNVISADDLRLLHQNSISVDDLHRSAEIDYSLDYVYTPNNTEVLAKHYLYDYSQEEIEYLNDYYATNEPYNLAECIGYATTQYNCHSYAWYSTDIYGNNYWIPYPDNYYSDMSYCEVTQPREGDIICYFDDNGTSDISDDENLHSGIVEYFDVTAASNNICGNSNQAIVVSKWGSGGLFRHRGDICVYTSNYGGNADYVKYYRPRTNDVRNLSSEMSVSSMSASLHCGGEITDRYVMYEFNVNDEIPYLITISSSVSLNTRFYNLHMDYCNLSCFEIDNNTYGYICTLDEGINYLRIQNVSETVDTSLIVTVRPHEAHTYEYKFIDSSYHILSCACGATSGSSINHVYTVADELGYAKCKWCGYLKYVGTGFVPIIKTKPPVTETDSIKEIHFEQ